MRADRINILPMPDVPAPDPANTAAHVFSVGAIIATMAGYLPYVVALIPAIYYLILIWESKTVQQWLWRRRVKKRARRIALRYAAKLQAQKDLTPLPPA